MKTFIKWSVRASGFFGLLFLVLHFSGQLKFEIWQSIIVFLSGSLFLGCFFYLIEDKIIPIQKKRVLKKAVEIFNAEPLSESQATFKIDSYDITIDVGFILSLNIFKANGEVVAFYLSKKQLQNQKLKGSLSNIEETLNGEPMCKIYQTNSMGLKLAKRRIEEVLK
jgi:hypothetical protein